MNWLVIGIIAVVKYIALIAISLTGKILALVYTPLVYWLRHYAVNAVVNYHMRTGKPFYRLDEVKDRYVSEGKKYIIMNADKTKRTGYVNKRHITWLEYWLVLIFIWFWTGNADDYLDITGGFMLKSDKKYSHRLNGKPRTATSMLVDGEWVDIGFVIKHHGSYLTIGDKQRENKIPLLKTIGIWYEWNVTRNGFYGWEYMAIETWFGGLSKKAEDWELKNIFGKIVKKEEAVRLRKEKTDNGARMYPDRSVMGYELTLARDTTKGIIKGSEFAWCGAWELKNNKAIGFEIGWRRLGGPADLRGYYGPIERG